MKLVAVLLNLLHYLYHGIKYSMKYTDFRHEAYKRHKITYVQFA